MDRYVTSQSGDNRAQVLSPLKTIAKASSSPSLWKHCKGAVERDAEEVDAECYQVPSCGYGVHGYCTYELIAPGVSCTP